MSPDLPKWVRLLLLVAAVIALAGCGGLFGDDPELPDGDEAVETYESLDAYNASFVQEITDDNGTDRWEGSYTLRPGAGEIYQYLETPDGERTVEVYNGTVHWSHDLDNNTVTRTQTAPNQLLGEQIRQIVNSANAGADDSDGAVLPVGPLLPVADGPTSEVATVGPNEVSHDGTETVAGREAHVVSMTAADEPDRFEQQLYLDTEWYVVLKVTTVIEHNGETTETAFRYTDIEYEPAVPEDLFEFDPPPETTVVEPSTETVLYSQPGTVTSETSFDVPDPEIPAAYEFLQAQHTIAPATEYGLEPTTDTDVIERVVLQYASETAVLSVAKANATFEERPGSEPVTVGDQEGQYSQLGGQSLVEWECDGNAYSAAGELSQSALLSIAESFECS